MRKHIPWVGLMALVTSGLCAQTRLIGTVQDAEGRPIPFADVSIGDAHFRSPADEHGEFRVSGLWPGSTTMHVVAINSQALDTTIVLAEGENRITFLLRPARLELSTVEVSALRAGDRAPFAKSVLTKERIERTNTGVDLPYLLEQQPSVVSTSDGGTGIGYTYMRIRGSDATRTNITVNGVPFNDAESQGAFLVNMPDLATSAEDIEVQRGVGTSTNGPAAFGASVNVRTTTVRREAWGLGSVSGESYNTQRYSVSAGTGLLADRFSFDMRLSSISSDGYVDRASADLKSYFLQGAWIGAKRSLRFITFRGKEITYQAWDGIPREIADTNRTYNGFTYDDQVDNYDQTHYQVLLDQKLSATTTMNVTLFRVNGAGYFEQFKPGEDLSDYGITPAVINGDTAFTSDIIRRRWLDNTLTGANASLEAKLGKHRLVVGGSYSDYRCAHFGEVLWGRHVVDMDIRYRYYDNDAKKTDANGFAKLTYALNDRMDVYADAQVRNVGYSYFGLDDVLNGRQQEHTWTFFNPKAGLLWRLGRTDKAYASFAVGNREPNRDDLEETTPASRPHPERLYDYEIGYEHRNGRLSGGVDLYYMDYVDQLVLTGELNDVGAALRTNVPRSYRAGVELMLAAQLTKRVQWRGNATLSRNKVVSFTEYVDILDVGFNRIGQQAVEHRDVDLAFSPSVIASSELSVRFWRGEARGNGDLALVTRYVGRQFLDNSGSTERSLDAYVVNDLRLNVDLLNVRGTRSIAFNVTVRNVFSELYESNGWAYSYYLEGGRIQGVNVYPQASINVLGGMTVRF